MISYLDFSFTPIDSPRTLNNLRMQVSSTVWRRMDRIRQQKIQKFEEFVDGRLKPDLVLAIAQRLSPSPSLF